MCSNKRFPMRYLNNMKNAMLTLPGLLGVQESLSQVTSWSGRFRIWRPGHGDLEMDLCCKWLKDCISRAKKWDTLHWPSISALSLAFRIFVDLGMESWNMGGVWQGKEPKWITFWLQVTSAKESIKRPLTSRSWRLWVLPLITFLKNVSSDDILGHNTRVPFIDNIMFPFTSLENSSLRRQELPFLVSFADVLSIWLAQLLMKVCVKLLGRYQWSLEAISFNLALDIWDDQSWEFMLKLSLCTMKPGPSLNSKLWTPCSNQACTSLWLFLIGTLFLGARKELLVELPRVSF